MPSVASLAPPSAHASGAFASASGAVGAAGAVGVQPIIVKLKAATAKTGAIKRMFVSLDLKIRRQS
jgi:hypothetical protein